MISIAKQPAKNGLHLTVTASTLAFALSATHARALEPANIQAGPVYLTPTLEVEARHVDNLFRSESNEQSSWVLDTRPRIQAWLQDGVNTYSLAYELRDSIYASSHDDDFTDQVVNLDVHHEFNMRNALGLNAEYYDGHEERGTGLSEGGLAYLIDEPVELERTRYGGKYRYGSTQAKGRLELGYQFQGTDYQNFSDFSQFRDRERDTIDGALFWRVAPRTDLLAEVRYLDTSYDASDQIDGNGSLDSEEFNYYLGVKWDATGKTDGSVRLGWYERDYGSSQRSSDDGFSWEADVNYRPRSYSTLNFSTRRFTQETNGLGNAVNTEEYAAAWNHEWSGRSSTYLALVLADDDYRGSRRHDERLDLEASYRYALRRWLDLSGGYRYEDRDSDKDVRLLDYQRNVFFIKAELSL